MDVKAFIGIDPDSQQVVCVCIDSQAELMSSRSFQATHEGARRFYKWVSGLSGLIVAFEGSSSHTRLFEKILFENEFQYYTFKARDVEIKRNTEVGPGKTNEKDALAVALLAKERFHNKTLSQWARYHRADDGLRELCRARERIIRDKTEEISQLCKFIKSRDSELYLYVLGKHPQYDNSTNILSNKGTLNLIATHPDLYTWKQLGNDELSLAMKTNYSAKQNHLNDFYDLSTKSHPGTAGENLLIRQSAQSVLNLMHRIEELNSAIQELSNSNTAVQALINPEITHLKGIGFATASVMVSEIIDIRRFPNNNKLAMYSGLGMAENETGLKPKNQGKKMKRFYNYNHRLKNAFMTMAKNVVLHNPDHRLTGMHKHISRQGMIPTEAYKRVARALVRHLFKILWIQKTDEIEKMKKGTGRQKGVKNAPIRHTA